MTRKTRTHLLGGSGDGTENVTPMQFMTKEEVGRNLYRLMIGKNMTQADLARGAKLSRTSISEYIKGRALPTQLSLEKLARVLGVKSEQIMPNHVASAISEDSPEFEFKASSADPSFGRLKIDRLVSFETGMKIGQLLAEDAANRE